MGKYVIIQDWRDRPSYGNIHARLLYLHVAMSCDISSYTYTTSYRRIASDLGLSLETVRHAVKVLKRDGLIATQRATQGTTQGATQGATQITIVRLNDLQHASNTERHTESHTESNTESHTHKNNKIIKKISLTHAVHVRERVERVIMETLGLDVASAASALDSFVKRQGVKKKEWDSEEDMMAHVVSWVEKRMPKEQKHRLSARQSDEKARQEEYQRTAEEVAKEDEKTKLTYELRRLEGYLRDFEKAGDEENATLVRDELAKLKKQ